MSGTSVDGVDTVLVNFNGRKVQVLSSYSQDFPSDLREDIFNLLVDYSISLDKLGEIDHRLGVIYSECVHKLMKKAGVLAGDVTAIGCHGQTIMHSPKSKYPFSMQIGDGNIIAARTGISTVNDLRRMDIAFGGQGAPLTPAFHREFFYSKSEKRIILNLGGIANITILNDKPLIGFDTGPANCLLDLWIDKCKGKKFDKNGEWARTGKINKNLLEEFLKEAYFALTSPKSTGRELFNEVWLNEKLSNFKGISDEDIQASLTELTVCSIVDEIIKMAPDTEGVYVCGGGAYNKFLLERLAFHLSSINIKTTEMLGMPVQLVESVAFAWLAKQRIEEVPVNLSQVTGARSNSVLGALYVPENF